MKHVRLRLSIQPKHYTPMEQRKSSCQYAALRRLNVVFRLHGPFDRLSSSLDLSLERFPSKTGITKVSRWTRVSRNIGLSCAPPEKKERLVRFRVVVMLNGHPDVHHTQKAKDHRLHQTDDNSQSKQRHRNTDCGELDKHEHSLVVPNHIAR